MEIDDAITGKIVKALDILVQDMGETGTMKAMLERLADQEPSRDETMRLLIISEMLFRDYLVAFARQNPGEPEAVTKVAIGALFTFGILIGKQMGTETSGDFLTGIDPSSLAD